MNDSSEKQDSSDEQESPSNQKTPRRKRETCPLCSLQLCDLQGLKRHLRHAHYAQDSWDVFAERWATYMSARQSKKYGVLQNPHGFSNPPSLLPQIQDSEPTRSEQSSSSWPVLGREQLEALRRLQSLLPLPNPNQFAVSPASTGLNYLSASSSSSQQQPTRSEQSSSSGPVLGSEQLEAFRRLQSLFHSLLNPNQFAVSPASTGFNYLSASSSSSQQQSPAIAQIPNVNFPGLPPAPRQIPPISQPLRSNIAELSNAPQQNTGTNQNNLSFLQLLNPAVQQLLASTTLGLANPCQQNISIAQLLGMSRPDATAPQQQNPGSSTSEQPRSAEENANSSTTLEHYDLRPLLLLSLIPDAFADDEVNNPTASTSQRQIDESNVPGTSSASGTSSGRQEDRPALQGARIDESNVPGTSSGNSQSALGTSTDQQEDPSNLERDTVINQTPEANQPDVNVSQQQQNPQPSTSEQPRVPVEGRDTSGNPPFFWSDFAIFTTTIPDAFADDEVNNPTASTSQRQIDESNVPGTSSASGTSSGQQEDRPALQGAQVDESNVPGTSSGSSRTKTSSAREEEDLPAHLSKKRFRKDE